MTVESWDVAVVGGGIAGASAAYELSRAARVLLLDMEGTLGHHATGRSAAMLLETYGGTDVRALAADEDLLSLGLDPARIHPDRFTTAPGGPP